MYKCPVCGKENETPLCAGCGFDRSQDYEGYPTLAAIPAGQPSRRARSEKFADLRRCEGCGSLLFYLNSKKGCCVCSNCGKEIPFSVPAAAPQQKAPVKQTPPPKRPGDDGITNYKTYMQALEKRYLENHRKPLTKAQIAEFVTGHQLDRRFQISTTDTEKDLDVIYAKYAVNPPVQDSAPKQITTYQEYLAALEQLYLKNEKQMLTKTQIAHFLSSNKLDKRFGISQYDVETDLKTIRDKYNQYKNLANVLQQKSARESSSLSSLLSKALKKK